MGPVTSRIDIVVRGAATDHEINQLHAAAFGHPETPVLWGERLRTASLTWVTARRGQDLVGFVNLIGDGGAHAVLLDTCVIPAEQGRGVGSQLVGAAADEARRLGCHWLHADYPADLAGFYEGACGLRPTAAGLLALR